MDYNFSLNRLFVNFEYDQARAYRNDLDCTTVLCKSNASEMREFRSLFLRTFLESSCKSSRDNSRLFERNFPTTKSAISLKFLYQTKVRRKFEVKSVVSSTSARNFALVRQNNSLRDIFDLLVM